jgi:hypothetical protein
LTFKNNWMSAPTVNTNTVGNRGAGRKSEYPESYSQSEKLAKLGLTDVEMALFFEVRAIIDTCQQPHASKQ